GIAGVGAGGPLPDIADAVVQAVGAYAIRVTANRCGQPIAAAIAGVGAGAGPFIAPRVAPLHLAARIPAGGLLPFGFQRQAHNMAAWQPVGAIEPLRQP